MSLCWFVSILLLHMWLSHRHKLPSVEPPRPLLEDLQFGPLANFQRSLAGANFAAAGLRGPPTYGTNFGPGMSSLRLLIMSINFAVATVSSVRDVTVSCN